MTEGLLLDFLLFFKTSLQRIDSVIVTTCSYTSIGSVDDTTPNEHLFDEKTKSYRPAYELKDGTLERAGRLKCKESQSQHKR